MFEITYPVMVAAIVLLWIIIRTLVGIRQKQFRIKRELLLLLVLICLVVVARFVYFPLRLVDGRIGALHFDASKILPFWINFVPFVHMADIYRENLLNVIGNIAMFIPVGVVWPACFKKLDKFWKALLAGGALSLVIEITQLLFYERSTDIDDLITNTTGVLIGAALFFGIRYLVRKGKEHRYAKKAEQKK